MTVMYEELSNICFSSKVELRVTRIRGQTKEIFFLYVAKKATNAQGTRFLTLKQSMKNYNLRLRSCREQKNLA